MKIDTDNIDIEKLDYEELYVTNNLYIGLPKRAKDFSPLLTIKRLWIPVCTGMTGKVDSAVGAGE